MSGTSYLVLGGARSGKTARALSLVASCPRRIYVATAEPGDQEMRDRIARHQSERGDGWQTIEAPLEIAWALDDADATDTGIVIDCLTLWLSNLMHRGADIERETVELTARLRAPRGLIVCVSNEIGLGLVPDTALGRRFRDAQGRLNQAVAAASHRVDFVAAGLALTLKSGAPADGM